LFSRLCFIPYFFAHFNFIESKECALKDDTWSHLKISRVDSLMNPLTVSFTPGFFLMNCFTGCLNWK
jgi:hypothetical protein